MKYILTYYFILEINYEKLSVGTQGVGFVEIVEQHTFSIGWRW